MKVKEKVIREALRRIEKRLTKIKSILDESPGVGILECYEKAQKISEEHKGDHKKISELIKPLAKEEERLSRIVKQQTGTKLWDERFTLESEKNELEAELYYYLQSN